VSVLMTPEHYDARAALWSARAVWPLLVGCQNTGSGGRPPTAVSTRPGRIERPQDGEIPGVTRPAPANVAGIDAMTRLLDVSTVAAWTLASSVRDLPGRSLCLQSVRADPHVRFAYVTGWLLERLADGSRLMAAEIVRTVGGADSAARRLLRVDHDRVALRVRCPACRERWLRVDTAAPDPLMWTVRCARPAPRCGCSGQQCPCGIAEGIRQSPHVWPAGMWRGEVRAACW
jgi:hypothetical protein